ncbi:hypothetical protein [Streptomyces sp. WM6386]|uniref:hypothetical protein n=1 Tax=Streptomyces sp. WM6386 TaxID=1415558 RepID=UPI0006193055|nr:hypothetical protein [Streptomyces sp. WM6386]KKD05977.1 hypothetical protein TN53_21680 [Streptomyces sp. WM6386]
MWHDFTLTISGKAKFTGKWKFNPSSTGNGGYVVTERSRPPGFPADGSVLADRAGDPDGYDTRT